MTLHDVWYFSVETSIDGERRGFSRQIKAREDRNNTVPKPVETVCQAFLAEVLQGSDVHTYDSVLRGERQDFPYRYATYTLSRNGETVVRSMAIKPVRPDLGEVVAA